MAKVEEKKVKRLTICTSASFYKKSLEVKSEIEKMGIKVIVPYTALKMRKTGDYSPSTYKLWYKDPAKFFLKARRMRWHFGEVAKSDAILIINLYKRGIEGYIGPNVLMEATIAFYLKKKMFIWNKITQKVSIYEEIMGMKPVFIEQDIRRIK